MAVSREGYLLELGASFAHIPDERSVLGRQQVADCVRKVDRGSSGLDGGAADGGDERGIGSGRVLAGELDLVHARAGPPDRGRRVGDDLVRPRPKLLLHVQRAGRKEDVDAGARRIRERSRRGLDIRRARAAERGDRDVLCRARNSAHAFEVAGRGGREAGLDHVDAEPLELLADLHLLVRAQRDSRCLLTVPKRCVEDCDPARAQSCSSLTRPR